MISYHIHHEFRIQKTKIQIKSLLNYKSAIPLILILLLSETGGHALITGASSVCTKVTSDDIWGWLSSYIGSEISVRLYLPTSVQLKATQEQTDSSGQLKTFFLSIYLNNNKFNARVVYIATKVSVHLNIISTVEKRQTSNPQH